jgi:hypothetical protein
MSVYEIVGDSDINYPSQKTKNIARILQSLNDSSDSSKIVINDAMKNFEKPSGLSLNEAIDDSTMTAILNEANTKKSGGSYSDIGETTAINNMKKYITKNHADKITNGDLSKGSEKPFEIVKLMASDTLNDYFGNSVSVSGDYIVVGAPYGDTGGEAYVFKKSIDGSVSQIAKLQSNDIEANDYFGETVSIDGDYIVISASGEDTGGSNAGAAYVFKRNSDSNVSQIAKIQASDAEASDVFGYSVSIDGDYIVASAYQEDTGGSNAGAAYVFKRNSDSNVSQIAKIQANDKDGGDVFGYSVSIDGDYIVVGAYQEDTGAGNAGATYVFKRNSDSDVSQIAKIQASDAEGSDYFGRSVSIDGDYIVVGAYGEDTGGSSAGAAYVFKRNSDSNVSQIAKIQASDAEASDQFGYSVSISGDYIVVSAYQEDTGGSNTGAAYVFKRNSDSDVSQIAKIQASDAEASDLFGSAVSIDGDYIVVGANQEDTKAVNAGAAYSFSLFPEKKPVFHKKPNNGVINADEGSNGTLFDFKAANPDNETITYTIEGTDASSFSINDSNLTFNSTPDYENPSDSGSDNNYSIKVVATDVSNKKTSVDVNVAVQDKFYFEKAKTLASDPEANDYFGNSVSVSGDYIVVGARYEDTGGSDSGAAYVFKKAIDGTVSQIAKIQASDAEEYDGFGRSVSISGDYIVVGALQEDTGAGNAGAAYVFKRNSDSNVSEIAKIQASDAEASDVFGSSVSISGDYIVVGAYQEDTGGANAGAAYVFKRNSDSNVSQIAKIQASDAEAGDIFGSSVSISGDYIVVGAYGEDTGASNAGAAYVFKRNSDSDVSQIAKIQPNDVEFGDNFGSSVSISGDYIVVGSYYEDTVAEDAGAAYVFKRNSDTSNDTTQIAKIQASDKEAYDYFGISVSISGDYIVVGAYGEDTGGNNTGAAYVFKRNSDSDVSQVAKLQASDKEVNDSFGEPVSIDGDYIVISATAEDSGASNAGAAYLFQKDPNQP